MRECCIRRVAATGADALQYFFVVFLSFTSLLEPTKCLRLLIFIVIGELETDARLPLSREVQ